MSFIKKSIDFDKIISVIDESTGRGEKETKKNEEKKELLK